MFVVVEEELGAGVHLSQPLASLASSLTLLQDVGDGGPKVGNLEI